MTCRIMECSWNSCLRSFKLIYIITRRMQGIVGLARSSCYTVDMNMENLMAHGHILYYLYAHVKQLCCATVTCNFGTIDLVGN